MYHVDNNNNQKKKKKRQGKTTCYQMKNASSNDSITLTNVPQTVIRSFILTPLKVHAMWR